MDKNSKPEVTNLQSTNNKVKVINFVLCLAIFAMIAYVFNISVLNHADWAKASGSGQSTEQVLEADRGTIYSSDKYAPAEVLAQSTTTFELCLDPFGFANEIKKIVNKEKSKYNNSVNPSAATEFSNWIRGIKTEPYVKINVINEIQELVEYLSKNLNIAEDDVIISLGLYTTEEIETIDETTGDVLKKTVKSPMANFMQLSDQSQDLRGKLVFNKKGQPVYDNNGFQITEPNGIPDDLDNVLELLTKNNTSNYKSIAKDIDRITLNNVLGFISQFGDVDPNDGISDKHTYGLTSFAEKETSDRYYPLSTLASSVIGFETESDKFGIEYQYNDALSGKRGVIASTKDGNGNTMDYQDVIRIEPVNGSDVYLTIDAHIQAVVEKELKNMSDEHLVGNRATAIVMNVNDGSILALANYPSYDLNNPYDLVYTDYMLTSDFYKLGADGNYTNANEKNQKFWRKESDNGKLYVKNFFDEEGNVLPAYKSAYTNVRDSQWKNKAVTEPYIPGSVFKLFTGVSGLNSGAITTNTSFSCVTQHIGGWDMKCSDGGHGTQNLTYALKNSCNPAFIEMGQAIGVTRFKEYLKAFNIYNGSLSGIDLPNEAKSFTMTDDSEVSMASSSFGQTTKLTPMEMMQMCAATVNGGYVVTPHVMDKIVAEGGEIVEKYETEIIGQAVSEQSSKALRQCLETATALQNPSKSAYIQGYHVAGKSGTAQKQDDYVNMDETGNPDNAKNEYIASYFCFAPANTTPEIAVLVIADQPDYHTTSRYYGSLIAVPAARNIMLQALPYVGVLPDANIPEEGTAEYEQYLKNTLVSMPHLTGKDVNNSKATLEELGLNVKIIGDTENGEVVTKQVPTFGEEVTKYSTVVLYTKNSTNQVTMPDLVNLSITEANAKLTESELNYIKSSASVEDDTKISYVVEQSIPPGTVIDKYSVVKLTLLPNDDSAH